MKDIIALTVMLIWIAGFVIAKDFWSTFFCIIPFWSFYLVIEKLMIYFGLI